MKKEHQLHMLRYTLTEQIVHGMEVSNLAYDVSRELGLPEELCHELAVAGIVHDIGKIPLSSYVEGEDTLVVEEMRFVRMHAQLSYEILKNRGYSDFIWIPFVITMKIWMEADIRTICPGKKSLTEPGSCASATFTVH